MLYIFYHSKKKIHSNFIHISPNLKSPSVPFNRRVDKQTVIYSYNALLLFSGKKNGTKY